MFGIHAPILFASKASRCSATNSNCGTGAVPKPGLSRRRGCSTREYLFRRANRLYFDGSDPLRQACLFRARSARRELETRHPVQWSEAALVGQPDDRPAHCARFRVVDLRCGIYRGPRARISRAQTALDDCLRPARWRSGTPWIFLLALFAAARCSVLASHSAFRIHRRDGPALESSGQRLSQAFLGEWITLDVLAVAPGHRRPGCWNVRL